MSEALEIIHQAQPVAIRATNDDEAVDTWLRKKNSANTKEIYAATIQKFRETLNWMPFRSMVMEDIEDWKDVRQRTLKSASMQRELATVKSLFRFLHDAGYLQINITASITLERLQDTLPERLMSEEDVYRLFAAVADQPRNELLIRLLYCSAGRVSEVIGLNWGNLQAREDGGQVSLFGKGKQTRNVLIPAKLWGELQASRAGAPDDAPVFTTKHGRMTRQTAWAVVKQAAKKAGLPHKISPHWLRHAHASHALQNGASIPLVRDTLGHADAKTTSKYLHARPDESSSTFLKVG